jgi:hypothetical protein
MEYWSVGLSCPFNDALRLRYQENSRRREGNFMIKATVI